MPLIEIAIVADDLTGALDSAAPFAARGADTRVAATPTFDSLGAPMPAVLSVSTTSRHLAGSAASNAVAKTCARLAQLEPGLWFKKIDSTLRGNVAVEVLATMATAGIDQAVICPAVPAQGRTVKDGVVLVDGVPLADTDFVKDAVSAASRQTLGDQFRALDPLLSVRECASMPPDAPAARTVWIVDAATDDDLAAIAAWVGERNGAVLAVGAAGLGAALADRLFKRQERRATQRIEKPTLFVIGSRATRTEAQVEKLLAGPANCRTISAAAGQFDPAQAAADIDHRTAIISIPHRSDDPPADTVARNLGRSVAGLLERVPFGTVFLTGGDTAAAVLAAIDQPVIALDGEVRPGVPLGHVTFHGKPLALVTKAGGFGDASLLADLAAAPDG